MGSKVDRGSTAQALAALRSLPAASVTVFDNDLRYLLVSGLAACAPGVDNAELEGRLIAEVQPGEWWAVWEPAARAALRGETNSVELMAPDERWYHVDVGPLRTPEGDVEGGVAVVTDITDRTRALTLAEGLLESAPDATVVVDGNGFIVQVNAQAERLFGYDRSELLARRVELLLPEQGRGGNAVQRSRNSTAPHARWICSDLELCARRKDGTEFPAEVSLSQLQTEDGSLISRAIRDVSEHKRLEGLAGHLAAVVESSADAIIGKTVEGIIVSWNPGAEHLYGYPAAEAIGRSIGMLIPAGHDDELPALMGRLTAGERVEQFETVRRRRDGVIVDVSLTLCPILDRDGGVTGVSVVARDITEQKHAAAALAQARGDIDRFFALSPDLMAVGDAEGRFTRVSRAWESVLGYKPEEVIGRLFSDFIHPDEIEPTLTIAAERVMAHLPGEYVNRYRCKDGSYRWIVWNAAVEGDVSLGTGRDVTERRELEEALRASERLAALAFEHAPHGIVLQGPDEQVIQVNQACADMLGHTREEILSGTDLSRQREELGPDAPIRAAFRAGGSDRVHYEKRYIRADGETVCAEVSIVALRDAGGAIEMLVTQLEDITEHKRLEHELEDANERELADSNARYRQILETTPDGIWRLDAEGATDYVNPRMAEMLGYLPQEIIGHPYADFMEPASLKLAEEHMAEAREPGEPAAMELRFVRKDGTHCWVRVSHAALRDAKGEVTGAIGIMSDITQAKSQQRELRSTEQFLGGLIESIGEGILAFDATGELKFANPAAERMLGWTEDELADRFLQANAGTLENSPAQKGLYGRLLSPLSTGTAVRTDDDTFTLRDGAEMPVAYSAAPIMIAGEVDGLVVVFSDVTKRKADEARRRKELEGAAWAGRIQDALDEDRFVLYQQPIIDVRTREIVRAELLIRMTGPDGEVIAPGRFLPTAEQYGLIAQIDLWVMRQACKLAANGQKVNFNISGQSLGSRDLIVALAAELTSTGADPALLVCEITETALAADEARAEAFVGELVDLGCEVALDDFGMGYGGFSRLKRFSFNELKIDLEFGRDLIDNPQSQNVVKAIVSLAKGFGRTTVAEGIEDVATLDLLQQYGVDYAQGYAIGEPAPIETARGKPKPATAVQPAPAKRRRRQGDAMCSRLARAYGETMRSGDPAAATAVIDDALRHQLSAPEIQSRVIAPAMREIGELWERGGLTVAQEHLASAVSYHVLTRLYPGLLRHSTRQGDTVVVAAVHGEHHVLGLRMVADVFDGAGFDVRFLGADVPESSLLAWVQEHEPAVVALGVTMSLGAATLARELQTLRDLAPGMQLVIGGQGVPNVLRAGAGVLYAADTEQLTAYLDSSLNTPAPGELPRGIAAGGVGFGRYAELPNNATGGLEARMAQTTAAAADAARGQARRAFVLEQLALRDPLTELWNRRAFDDRYQELTVGGELNPPTIVMIDVDQFKSINDGFGHDAGDRALIGVARGILSALRPGDFAARYGGDEFVVLLPDTPHDEAARIAERIRIKIEASMTDPPLTVSIGVSVPEHTDRRRASLDVDQALYTAKEHGRNQVVFAELTQE